jgi:hypothetical protein
LNDLSQHRDLALDAILKQVLLKRVFILHRNDIQVVSQPEILSENIAVGLDPLKFIFSNRLLKINGVYNVFFFTLEYLPPAGEQERNSRRVLSRSDESRMS